MVNFRPFVSGRSGFFQFFNRQKRTKDDVVIKLKFSSPTVPFESAGNAANHVLRNPNELYLVSYSRNFDNDSQSSNVPFAKAETSFRGLRTKFALRNKSLASLFPRLHQR